MHTDQRVAIVGAGPAGISAAVTLADHRIPVVLVDEAPAAGGQYYKHYGAAPSTSRGRELDQLYLQGIERAARLRHPLIETRFDTTVWGFFEPDKLGLVADEQVDILRAPNVLIATGAIERVAAFPGWTLPGVMTAGAAQRLLSHDRVLPGRRFILAGTGPLLLAVAAQIAEAGGQVAAVIDCTGFTEPVRNARTARQVLREPGRMKQLVSYRRTLQRAGTRYFHNYTVVEARGDDYLQEVVIAKKDADWNIIAGTEEVLHADTLCLHYGFSASLELPQLAGCETNYEPRRGGWHVVHDDGMRTSRSGFYVAGQPSGIGGADLAEATGELAGLTIARDLGALDDARYRELADPVRRKVRQGRDFAEMLNTIYSPPPAIASLVEPTTLLCRCEEVSASQVDQGVAAGAVTLDGLKRHTRCGMGFCQGRVCSQVLSSYLEFVHGMPPQSTKLFNARTPLKPISIGALATIPQGEI